MQFLSFFDNRFTGTISSSIQNLTNLFHLDASSNALTGEFPDFLGEMKDLSYLFLGNNIFDAGPIPGSFSNLINMEELSLKGTNRTGHIPTFIGDLYSKLKLLDLDKNNFRCVLRTIGDEHVFL